MAVYIVGFALSILLLYFAERRNFRGTNAKICVVFALIFPCMIAGMRNEIIGTDVLVYAKPLFETAAASDTIMEYFLSGYSRQGWDYTAVADIEFGFTLLVFVVQRLFNSMPVLLFAIQAMTIIPIYLGLRGINKTRSVWLCMAVYYLMFFNQTLNLMRQWIAMAFLMYAFQFLFSNHYRKYFIVVIIATLFHVSAMLGIAIFAIYKLTAPQNTYNKALKAFLLIVIGAITIMSLDFVVRLMGYFGLRYGTYINGQITFMPNQLLYRIPIFALLVLRWRYIKNRDRLATFYVVTLAYDVLASQLTSVFEQSGRIALLFSEYFMLLYPAICMSSTKKNNRRVMVCIVLCYLSIYWWYNYVLSNNGETVPYISILG